MKEQEQYVLTEDTPAGPPQTPRETLPEVVVDVVGKIEDVPAGTIKNALVKLSVDDMALAKVKADILTTLAKWDGSKASYEAVKRARLDLVPKRVAVEKEAKEGRAEALAIQRLWLGAEKAVTGFYADLEAQCSAKEFEYTEVIRKEAEEKQRIERERVTKLYEQLKAYDWPGNELICAQYTPEQFESELAKAKANWETVQAAKKAEAERLAKEEKDRAEQEERNRAEAERLRLVEEKQRAEQARIDADRKKAEEDRQKALKEIEDKKAAAVREIEEKRAAAEAERVAVQAEANRKEQERLAEERRILEAKQAEEDRLKAEAEEKERLAALAPDKEKILEWTRKSWEFVSHVPTLKDHGLQEKMDSTAESIDTILAELRLSLT